MIRCVLAALMVCLSAQLAHASGIWITDEEIADRDTTGELQGAWDHLSAVARQLSSLPAQWKEDAYTYGTPGSYPGIDPIQINDNSDQVALAIALYAKKTGSTYFADVAKGMIQRASLKVAVGCTYGANEGDGVLGVARNFGTWVIVADLVGEPTGAVNFTGQCKDMVTRLWCTLIADSLCGSGAPSPYRAIQSILEFGDRRHSAARQPRQCHGRRARSWWCHYR